MNTMKRFSMMAMGGLVATLAACATEAEDPATTQTYDQASNVHLKGGPRAEPSFVDNGLSLSSSGDLSGLGNADVVITLDAIGNPKATCKNPGSGEKLPPGQNPAPVEVTGSQSIPASEIKNGTVHFSVSTSAPAANVAGAPDCPNSSWTETIYDMMFTDATITVEQPVGTIVLGVACTFNPATKNGAVSGATVDCTVF